VGSNDKKIKKQLAKYLPKTICHLDNGFVKSSSIVPDFTSSEKARMVIAGIRKRKIKGEIWKNRRMSA
jgi:hypothetical protein